MNVLEWANRGVICADGGNGGGGGGQSHGTAKAAPEEPGWMKG